MIINENQEAVKRACLDYVEGYFEKSSERIETGVHSELVKRNISNNRISEMTRELLIRYATGHNCSKPEINVEVYDIFGDIATCKITSEFVDYAQLARINGNWKVINVLWANR